jgi:hypothetical protein
MAKPPPRLTLHTSDGTARGDGPGATAADRRGAVTILFCDDIRLEASGKITLVGHYLSELCLLTPNATIDRCALYLHATWRWDQQPGRVVLRVELPGQESSLFPVQLAARPASPPRQPPEAFPEVFMVQSVLQLRFPPLRAGDTIRVFLRGDDGEQLAGRLLVRRAGTPAVVPQNLPPNAQPELPGPVRH